MLRHQCWQNFLTSAQVDASLHPAGRGQLLLVSGLWFWSKFGLPSQTVRPKVFLGNRLILRLPPKPGPINPVPVLAWFCRVQDFAEAFLVLIYSRKHEPELLPLILQKAFDIFH